jgi:glycosyltransferase involved in cell wall biosynthesis
MESPLIYIVIPAYNEEKNIAKVIASLRPLYERIIVVDDCSQDKTAQLAQAAGALVLRHPLNRGQGAALETGDRFALSCGAEIIVHFDADGQFLAEDIAALTAPILAGRADIVLGSRFMGEESDMPVFKKKIIMPLARFFLSVFYGAVLTDPQNGFRALSRKVAERLQIENDGAAHCTEIIAKTLKNSWRYEEVPVRVIYEHFGQGLFSGKGRGTGGLKIIKSLFMQKFLR